MLLQLSDRSAPPSGVIDTGVVDRALANTDALIDGYLGGRYVLPLAETPPLLAGLAQEIAIYKLHAFQPDPKIEQEYKDALSQLDKISKGTIRLPLATVGEPAVTGADGVIAVDREREFTPENMTGFI